MSIVSYVYKNFVNSRKINVFLIFFVLAFFILILARLSASYTNTIKFNLDIKNIPDEVLILKNTSNTLNVTMTTQGFEWMKYYLNTPEVTIDFKNDIRKTDSLYIWTLAKGYEGVNNQFKKDVSVKTINPDTLVFKVDINAVKMIPVIPKLNLSYSPGYNVLDAIVTKPDSVKVIGPKTLLSKLEFIETEALNKTNIYKSFNTDLKLNLEATNPQIKFKTEDVSITIKVEKFTEGVISIPITMVNVPKNIKITYFPKAVNLSYYTSLETYNTISKKDFKVVCDFNRYTNKSTFFTPELKQSPKGIKNVRLHQQKIEYIISE